MVFSSSYSYLVEEMRRLEGLLAAGLIGASYWGLEWLHKEIDRCYYNAVDNALFIHGEAFDPFDYLMGGPGVYETFA